MTDQPPSDIEPVALAQALIRRPSVTPLDAGALDVLRDALEPLGFDCHAMTFTAPGTDDVTNLYARLGTATPNFCFAGHTDVVPTGDSEIWDRDPFAGDIVDGALFGRGAADMKSAIAAEARTLPIRIRPKPIAVITPGIARLVEIMNPP